MTTLEYPPDHRQTTKTPENQVVSDILTITSQLARDDGVYHYWPDHMSETFARNVQHELASVGLHAVMRETWLVRGMEKSGWGLDVILSNTVVPIKRK